MLQAMKDVGALRIFVTGVLIWFVRLAAVFPFLDANGRVPSLSPDGRIPVNVEYFFSALIAVVTLATLAGTAFLLGRRTSSRPSQEGMAVAIGLLVSVSLLDILFTVFLNGRGFANWFVNVALDYSPIVLIPVVVGRILQSRAAAAS